MPAKKKAKKKSKKSSTRARSKKAPAVVATQDKPVTGFTGDPTPEPAVTGTADAPSPEDIAQLGQFLDALGDENADGGDDGAVQLVAG